MKIPSLLLFALVALPGCGDRTPPPEAPAKTGPPAVAAVVDGEVLLRSDIDAQVDRRSTARGLDPEDRRRLFRSTLDEAILAALVDGALRRGGIQVAPEEVDLELEARKATLGDEGFTHTMGKTGQTLAELRADLRREIGLTRLLDSQDPLRIDPANVERLYRLEHGDSASPREARFSLILLRLPPDAGPVEEERIRRDLLRILHRIEGKMTFEEAAKAFSQDPTREFEGQWEFTELERLEPLLRAAVEAAPAGEVIGPARTAEGWVLLRVDGRRSEMNMAVAEQKAQIRARLLTGRTAERRGKFLKRLREEATVEVAEDLR